METGFVPDHNEQIIHSHWHPGDPSDSTFFGKLKLDLEAVMSVTAFRCPQCGLLKQFANK